MTLPRRKRDVLEQLSNGFSYKQVANILGIKEATVKKHVSWLFKMYKVKNKTQLLVLAVRRGLI